MRARYSRAGPAKDIAHASVTLPNRVSFRSVRTRSAAVWAEWTAVNQTFAILGDQTSRIALLNETFVARRPTVVQMSWSTCPSLTNLSHGADTYGAYRRRVLLLVIQEPRSTLPLCLLFPLLSLLTRKKNCIARTIHFSDRIPTGMRAHQTHFYLPLAPLGSHHTGLMSPKQCARDIQPKSKKPSAFSKWISRPVDCATIEHYCA